MKERGHRDINIYQNNTASNNGGRVENVFDDSEKRANIKLSMRMSMASMGDTNLFFDLVVGHVKKAQLTLKVLPVK